MTSPGGIGREGMETGAGPGPHPAPDAGVYVMSVAAELAGVHPQTLRVYERRGLLAPARTVGGSRRYSDADLDRLHHIGELTGAGVSIEGVRRILELEAELAAVSAELDRLRDHPRRSVG